MVAAKLESGVMAALHAKRYEPAERWAGGVFGYVAHRFPIKNGISASDVMAARMFSPCPLLAYLKGKGRRADG